MISLNDLSNIAGRVMDIVTYVMAIGSLLDAISPPPLGKDDEAKTLFDRFRKGRLYSVYSSLIKFCAANIGWARDLVSSRGTEIIQEVISGATDPSSLDQLAQTAKDAVNDKKKEIAKNEEEEDHDNDPPPPPLPRPDRIIF